MQIGNKVKRSYSMSESANNRLIHLAEKWGIPQTRVLEWLLEISPDDYPEKIVKVVSLNPLAYLMNERWEGEFTGTVLVEFHTQAPISQMTISVKKLTSDELSRWLVDRYIELNLSLSKD
jgi:hypothetical protein